MKKELKRLISIIVIVCICMISFKPVWATAKEEIDNTLTISGNNSSTVVSDTISGNESNVEGNITVSGNESSTSSTTTVSGNNSDENVNVSISGGNAGDEKRNEIIMAIEDLDDSFTTMIIYDKPSYEELLQSLPQKLYVSTERETNVAIEVEWVTESVYEEEWNEIVFEAVIDEKYVLAEEITLPIVRITLMSAEDNEGLMVAGNIVLEGEGTVDNPYLIYDIEDFEFVRLNNDADIYYKLMADINLDKINWVPLGLNNNDEEAFCANFDGNGHKLYNYSAIYSTYSSYGIFGYVRNASISNLGIIVKSGTQIKSEEHGAIMMRDGMNSCVDNCYVIGDYITTSKYAGEAGLLARAFSGEITNCYVQGKVEAYGYYSLTSAPSANAGGIVAIGNAIIRNCICIADVSCKSTSDKSFAGGISGGGNSIIENCLFIGSTSLGTGKVIGQIYGNTSGATVTNSYYVLEQSANPEQEVYGTGKTISELREQSTYVGWDFENIWTMNDSANAGFPILQSMTDIERPKSEYMGPYPLDYSQRSGQVILSNQFEMKVYFDRDIEVINNEGVYFKDVNGNAVVKCEYEVINARELYVKTSETMNNGIKYTLVINDDCIVDAEYNTNYCNISSNQYFVTVCEPFFEGDGSAENPYVIKTVEHLNCVYYQPSMHYVLANDIDASSVKVINSIGGCKDTSGSAGIWYSYYDTETQGEKDDFSGVFDGQGHTISGINQFSGQSAGGYTYDVYGDYSRLLKMV